MDTPSPVSETVWPQGIAELPVVPGTLEAVHGSQHPGRVYVHRDVDVGKVRELPGRADVCNADKAARARSAVLAEQQVFAVRSVGDTAAGAIRVLTRGWRIGLQHGPGLGVEYRDRLGRTHLQYGGGMVAGWVQRHCLGPGPDAEVHLRASWGEDLAAAGYPLIRQCRRIARALLLILVGTDLIRWKRRGLRERCGTQPCRRQEASDRAQSVDHPSIT